jgi:hypothetical protein
MSNTQPRAFDAPDISATRFLVAVMHDKTVDLKDRMVAADLLCKMGLSFYREREIRITINVGGVSAGGAKMLNNRAKGEAYVWARE